MTHIANGQHLTSAAAARFEGFVLPTSNTTYAPNQFFDVCLPHYPRGVVRLVAYVIRKTLGWCDAHGNPQSERHRISFNELESKAGISRDMIRSAVEEAIAGHFIRRVRLGAEGSDRATSLSRSPVERGSRPAEGIDRGRLVRRDRRQA
jgi:hypothetical protein